MSLYDEVVVTITSAYLVEAEDVIECEVWGFYDISSSEITGPVERVIHHYDKDKVLLEEK